MGISIRSTKGRREDRKKKRGKEDMDAEERRADREM